MISRPLSADECTFHVTALLSDHNETEAVKRLRGDDAQTFVDVVDEVLPTPASRMNRAINLRLGFPFLPTGVGYAGAVATGEVFGRLAQDMWSPVFTSEIRANPASQRSISIRAVSRRVR